ncbi:MAG: uroporphyrinogen-III synthase [Cyanobacteria bacterium]|nr:uroporphyrinogen-III synthase [Cyanobacteriota bacterium]
MPQDIPKYAQASPLKGFGIVLTQSTGDQSTGDPSASAFDILVKQGAHIHRLPLIQTQWVPYSLQKEVFRWLFFTSTKGVEGFFQSQQTQLTHVNIASIGPATTDALGKYGLLPSFESPSGSGEAFTLAFQDYLKDKPEMIGPVLWPCGNLANPRIKSLWQETPLAGFYPLEVYQTKDHCHSITHINQALSSSHFIVFASPSAVQSLKNQAPEWFKEDFPLKIVCIGETTANKSRELLGRVDIIPEKPSYEHLAMAITDFLLS